MRTGHDHFKETIEAYLEKEAANDPMFAKSFAKEGKTIDKCLGYIYQQVQESGRKGFTDPEIYGLAKHYYDEDNLKDVKPRKMQVVVNHKPELNEDELAELKEQAKAEVIRAEKQRLQSKKKRPTNLTPVKKEKKENTQSSLF